MLLFLVAACGDTLRTATGVVTDIDANGLETIVGFTLRTPDGEVLRFDTTTTRFDPDGFPPQHLQEHRSLAEPIRVTYQVRGGVNHVVKLEDAEPPGA